MTMIRRLRMYLAGAVGAVVLAGGAAAYIVTAQTLATRRVELLLPPVIVVPAAVPAPQLQQPPLLQPPSAPASAKTGDLPLASAEAPHQVPDAAPPAFDAVPSAAEPLRGHRRQRGYPSLRLATPPLLPIDPLIAFSLHLFEWRSR